MSCRTNMKRNPRDKPVALAQTQLRIAIHSIAEDYDLSISELMYILTDVSAHLFRQMMKDEQDG